MTGLVNVTITAPDEQWLRGITYSLIESRLAASGNVTAGATSVYRWQGSIHKTSEAVTSLRTQARHVGAIIEAVTSEHPYEVPHIVAVPIVDANPDYAAWIRENTGGDGE